MFKQASSTRSIESGLHLLNSQKYLRRILETIEEFQWQWVGYTEKFWIFWTVWLRKSIVILKKKNKTDSELGDSVQTKYFI